MKPLPPLDELADDLFIAASFSAERLALQRAAINEAGMTGLSERRLAEGVARLNRLSRLGTIVYHLIPHEPELRRLLEELVSGEGRRDSRLAAGAASASP
jgi:hypothetical protein